MWLKDAKMVRYWEHLTLNKLPKWTIAHHVIKNKLDKNLSTYKIIAD